MPDLFFYSICVNNQTWGPASKKVFCHFKRILFKGRTKKKGVPNKLGCHFLVKLLKIKLMSLVESPIYVPRTVQKNQEQLTKLNHCFSNSERKQGETYLGTYPSSHYLVNQ